MTNEVQNGVVVDERLSSPVIGDRGEQAMFDGIPLRGAGRKVADFHMQTEAVTKRDLELMFPQASPVAVTATAVSQDKQMVGIRILFGSDLCPPCADRVYGELRRVTGGADADETVVTEGIVDAIGNSHPFGIGRKVMVKDFNEVTAPSTSRLGGNFRQVRDF